MSTNIFLSVVFVIAFASALIGWIAYVPSKRDKQIHPKPEGGTVLK